MCNKNEGKMRSKKTDKDEKQEDWERMKLWQLPRDLSSPPCSRPSRALSTDEGETLT
jgi:hypothetical protein